MNINELTKKLSEKSKSSEPLEKSIKFDFSSDGIIFVDGYNNNHVSNEDKDADCTILVSIEDFIALAKGELNPMNAFMGGKLKIMGDMSAAMQLQGLLN